jgi:hypothetical protein
MKFDFFQVFCFFSLLSSLGPVSCQAQSKRKSASGNTAARFAKDFGRFEGRLSKSFANLPAVLALPDLRLGYMPICLWHETAPGLHRLRILLPGFKTAFCQN